MSSIFITFNSGLMKDLTYSSVASYFNKANGNLDLIYLRQKSSMTVQTLKENLWISKSARTLKFTAMIEASYEVYYTTATSYHLLRRSAVTF